MTTGLRETFEKVSLKDPFKTSRTLKAKRAFVPFRFQLDFSWVILMERCPLK